MFSPGLLSRGLVLLGVAESFFESRSGKLF